jgi:serine/threonine protein kinase
VEPIINEIDYDLEMVNMKNEIQRSIARFTESETLESIGVEFNQIIDTLGALKHQRIEQDIELQVKLKFVSDFLEKISVRRLVDTCVSLVHENDVRLIPDSIKYLDGLEYSLGYLNTCKVNVVKFSNSILSFEHILMLRDLLEKWDSVCHPNCITLTGAFINRSQPIVIYPYMENGNVLDYLESHPETSLKNRISIIRDLAFGLEGLNFSGFPHGQVCAENLYLGIFLII